jgi:hypothetical protein
LHPPPPGSSRTASAVPHFPLPYQEEGRFIDVLIEQHQITDLPNAGDWTTSSDGLNSIVEKVMFRRSIWRIEIGYKYVVMQTYVHNAQ